MTVSPISRWWFHPALLLAALSVPAALAVPTPAAATTPGRNGLIAYNGYLDADRTTRAIFTIRPAGTRARQWRRALVLLLVLALWMVLPAAPAQRPSLTKTGGSPSGGFE
jgi:hypothetical protein